MKTAISLEERIAFETYTIASAGTGRGGITIGFSSDPKTDVAEVFNFAIVNVIVSVLIVIGSASGFVAKKPAAINSYGGCTRCTSVVFVSSVAVIVGIVKTFKISVITLFVKFVSGISFNFDINSVNGTGLNVIDGVAVILGVIVGVIVTDWDALSDVVDVIDGLLVTVPETD